MPSPTSRLPSSPTTTHSPASRLPGARSSIPTASASPASESGVEGGRDALVARGALVHVGGGGRGQDRVRRRLAQLVVVGLLRRLQQRLQRRVRRCPVCNRAEIE